MCAFVVVDAVVVGGGWGLVLFLLFCVRGVSHLFRYVS